MYITYTQLKRTTEGNPGAIHALLSLGEYMKELSPIYVDKLEANGVIGSEIAVLFQVVCKRDVVKFCDIVGDGQELERLKDCPDSKFYVKGGK